MKVSEQRRSAKMFFHQWEGKGYEKGESQKYWISLLRDVYGVEDTNDYIRFEEQVKVDSTNFLDAYIPSTHVLIEQKGIDVNLQRPTRQSDGSYLTPFQQARRYSANLPYSKRPRWVVICNFKEFHIYDMERPNLDPEILLLENLESEYYRLYFLINKDEDNIQKETEVSLQAGELVGVLYDALLKEYENPDDKETLHHLNVLCVRIVFCLYAEDAGLFGRRNMFHDYLKTFEKHGFRQALMGLFKILNIKEKDRDPYISDNLAAFPYVDGGLFELDIIVPRINEEIIDIILNQASANFDWSQISPTIFGAVFESTLNPETRREGGMHYTSLENIHKLIDPLFLDDLNEEFDYISKLKTDNIRIRKLREFHKKLSSLKFLDPACGSGNFLTETYISLRRLENKIIKRLYGFQIALGGEGMEEYNPISISISQFYGIEINDFAVTVANTALWIAESQMMKETEDIIAANLEFFPIDNSATIVEGNALRMSWEDLVPNNEISYIMGNPPFSGARLMNKDQKEDLTLVFGKLKGVGNLDYVSGWYQKAADYIDGTSIRCSFVSTNSITQGQQVDILWRYLYEKYNIKIDYAFRTFIWTSEASNQASVYCVIVGFSQGGQAKNKYIYTNQSVKLVRNINAYLVDAPNIFIGSRSSPIVNVRPMFFGSMANDDGNLSLTAEERDNLIRLYPESAKFIKPFMGASEFIHNRERWCLWITSEDLLEVSKIKPIMDRIRAVRAYRLTSDRKNTRKLANVPYLFGEVRQPETDYLLIPRVSSENRLYIPIGFMDSYVIASDAVLTISRSSISHFALTTSNVHMAWMRAVAGRLEGRYRYSATIVYNNFPWININNGNYREILENTGQGILDARKMYPDWTLAKLYNQLIMPLELRKAHEINDRTVMEIYGFNWHTMTEPEIVAELIKMYQKLAEEQ